MNTRLHHVALRVRDPQTSLKFYSGLLGLHELQRDARDGFVRSIWLAAGETVLMLERELRGTGASQGSAHLIAFEVKDLAAWERRIAEVGIPLDDRTEHTLYIRDLDGHRVGLSDYRFR